MCASQNTHETWLTSPFACLQAGRAWMRTMRARHRRCRCPTSRSRCCASRYDMRFEIELPDNFVISPTACVSLVLLCPVNFKPTLSCRLRMTLSRPRRPSRTRRWRQTTTAFFQASASTCCRDHVFTTDAYIHLTSSLPCPCRDVSDC